jgi:phage major head subunit gpT-like protein
MPSQFDSVWVPTLQGAFLSAYEGGINAQWASPIMRKYESPGEFLKLTDLGSVGSVQSIVDSLPSFGEANAYPYMITNSPFQIGQGIDVEDVERDEIGMWEAKVQEMGGKMANHPTKLVTQLLQANPVCYDGATYFNTSHPQTPEGVLYSSSSSGTVQSNDLNASQIGSLDVNTAAAPTAAEFATALLDVITHFYTLKDEAGDPINGEAKSFLIVSSNPKIYASATSAINSMVLNGGNGSFDNPIKAGLSPKGYSFDVATDPRIGSLTSSVFYVFRTDSIIKPFAWSEEKPVRFMYQGAGSHSEIYDNKYLWSAKGVFNVGAARWQHAARATLS